jgi:hypothetical protein
MIQKSAPVLAAAASALLLSGPALAATHHHHHHAKTFAACSARGEFATCQASGSAAHPSSLWVHVRAKSQQTVTGQWVVTCVKGTGARAAGGSFSGKTVLTRRMKTTYRHPDSCMASAFALLTQRGSIHIWLTVGR